MNAAMKHPFDDINLELLLRVLSGAGDARDHKLVNDWLEADDKNKIYFNDLSTLWNVNESSGTSRTEWLTDDWKKVQHRINEIRVTESIKTAKQKSLAYTFTRLAAAIILCVGIYFFTQQLTTTIPVRETIASEGVKTLTLPDGSIVSLNSNAKLTYPETFDTEKREVTLEGEAFFEIAPNAKKPFLIKTGKATTEVVGTSFNVDSNQESVVVTVVTGKVIFYENKSTALSLTIGEQGVYDKGGLKKMYSDDLNFLSWKTNVLTFQNTPLTKVVNDLNRHYGHRLQIASEMLEGCKLTSTFHNQTLEEILRELTVVFSIELQRTGNVIVIRGKGC